MQLCYYGNPILRQKAEPIEEITDEIRELAAQMIALVQSHTGYALAAPQVGQSIRMFVVCGDTFNDDGSFVRMEPMVYINPKLSEPSEEMAFMDEACFSIPGISVPVERPVSITIEAMNLNGEVFTKRLEGVPARVRMHENDHLNGVLTIDRTSRVERKAVEPILRKIKKRYA